MRRLILRLKAAWLYSRFFPYVEEADAQGFWTDGDAQRTAQFFQSQTGQKLGHRLRNYAIQAATSAVKNPTNSSFNNGVAAGIPMLIIAIENHYASASTESEESEELAGLEETA